MELQKTKKDSWEPWRAVESMEAELGLKKGFYWDLYKKDDDWSFIIKLHALVETAVSLLLSIRAEDAVLHTLLNLNLHGRVSKMRLLNDFFPAVSEIKGYIQGLSELRNQFVHDVTKTNILLKEYVQSLKGQRKQNFIKRFSLSVADQPTGPDGKIYEQAEFVELYPREALLFGGISTLHLIYLLIENIRLKKEIKKLNKETLRMEASQLASKFVDVMKAISQVAHD